MLERLGSLLVGYLFGNFLTAEIVVQKTGKRARGHRIRESGYGKRECKSGDKIRASCFGGGYVKDHTGSFHQPVAF